MTVASETNKSGPYNGNGVTTAFDYEFRIVDEDHVQVILTSVSGAETVLTKTTDYSVTGVGDTGGGQIIMVVPPATGEKLTLLRSVPFVQETDLENQGAYNAEDVEDALDLGVMMDQQLQEQISRTVQIPVSADPSVLPALIGNVIRLASSADNIDAVAGSIDDVNDVAGNLTAVETVAQNLADVTNFSSVYLGAHADDPSTRTDGSPLVVGDLYFSTSGEVMNCWQGVTWVPAAAASIGGLLTDTGTFGPAPDGIVFVGNFTTLFVWLNGALLREGSDYTQNGVSFTIISPVADDEWSYWAYQANDATDYYTKSEIDADYYTKEEVDGLTPPLVTTSANGLMAAADKSKLDGIAAGAQVNPGAATTSVAGLMSSGDKTKLDGVAAGAQVNPTAAAIKASYESNANTNAFTDALLAKVNAGGAAIPTSTTYPVGTVAMMMVRATVGVPGGTIAGSSVEMITMSASGVWTGAGAQTGTWTNRFGSNLTTGAIGLLVRTA